MPGPRARHPFSLPFLFSSASLLNVAPVNLPTNARTRPFDAVNVVASARRQTFPWTREWTLVVLVARAHLPQRCRGAVQGLVAKPATIAENRARSSRIFEYASDRIAAAAWNVRTDIFEEKRETDSGRGGLPAWPLVSEAGVRHVAAEVVDRAPPSDVRPDVRGFLPYRLVKSGRESIHRARPELIKRIAGRRRGGLRG
ncbi:hypothetical protein KM043_003347 [Ampulex compressa]|nr:hypothetical protein KM043_003347 [Ampulex compressa]